jgi:excisionase family DNA binding protein
MHCFDASKPDRLQTRGLDMGEATKESQTPILLSPSEAAAKLGLSVKQITRLANFQEIGHVRLGDQIYFTEASLQEWVVRNTSKVW